MMEDEPDTTNAEGGEIDAEVLRRLRIEEAARRSEPSWAATRVGADEEVEGPKARRPRQEPEDPDTAAEKREIARLVDPVLAGRPRLPDDPGGALEAAWGSGAGGGGGDEGGGSAAARRGRGTLVWIGLAAGIAAVAVGAGLMWQGRTGTGTGDPAKHGFPNALRALAEERVRAVLEAASWPELIPHVRGGDAMRPAMEAYYSAIPFEPRPIRSLALLPPRDYPEGVRLAEAAVTLADGEDGRVVVELGPGGSVLVDWEMLVDFGEFQWRRFREDPPTTVPATLRVSAMRVAVPDADAMPPGLVDPGAAERTVAFRVWFRDLDDDAIAVLDPAASPAVASRLVELCSRQDGRRLMIEALPAGERDGRRFIRPTAVVGSGWVTRFEEAGNPVGATR